MHFFYVLFFPICFHIMKFVNTKLIALFLKLHLGTNIIISPEIGTSSIDWAQMSRFYLKTERESSLRNVVFWKINRTVFLDKDKTMDNVHKHIICTNVPSLQILDLIYCTWVFSVCGILIFYNFGWQTGMQKISEFSNGKHVHNIICSSSRIKPTVYSTTLLSHAVRILE
jgi:hypothetical protein